ncbi:hypothetical protein BGZ76_006547 [Entomortierella beljakovae]|nr:hypothetical protein BGZ76_006547 [Entomortierella beljakovae]
MLFNVKCSVALILCLGLSVVSAAPVTEQSMEKQSIIGDVVGSVVGGVGDLVGDVVWPVGFTKQCNALYTTTRNLDIILRRINANHGWSCSAAVRSSIGIAQPCTAVDLIANIAWPIAFAEQENLSTRIANQVKCMAEFQKL